MPEKTSSSEAPLASSIEKLRQELDRWWDVACEQSGRALDKFGIRAGSLSGTPAIDVVETPEAVTVAVDVPGVLADQVTVELTGHMLTVTGDRTNEESDETKTVHVRERFQGSFRRSIPLPAPVQTGDVSANVQNGVLLIQLAKAEVAKPKRIPVSAERGSCASAAKVEA